MDTPVRKKDDGKPITANEWTQAIAYLLDTIPLRFFRDVRAVIITEGQNWGLKRHLGLGMKIRNILREGGFQWGNLALDDYWYHLLEDAVQLDHHHPIRIQEQRY